MGEPIKTYPEKRISCAYKHCKRNLCTQMILIYYMNLVLLSKLGFRTTRFSIHFHLEPYFFLSNVLSLV